MANIALATRRGTNREVDDKAATFLQGWRTAKATTEITTVFETRIGSSSLSAFDTLFSGFRHHLYLSCGATTALLAAATEAITQPRSADDADVVESIPTRNGAPSASTAVLENTAEQRQAVTETLSSPSNLVATNFRTACSWRRSRDRALANPGTCLLQ